LTFSVYLLPAAQPPTAEAIAGRVPILVCNSYEEAQAYFRSWLRENLEVPSFAYPYIIMDEVKE
jgi:hypothetical protein